MPAWLIYWMMIVMKMTRILLFSFSWLAVTAIISCRKDRHRDEDKNQPTIINQASLKTIVYTVKGTHFRMNYIDSNSIFRRDGDLHDFFRYEFRKGSGASIGMSVFPFDTNDEIYSWTIYIDGKLYANAFSEGGAYFTVPYN